MNSNRILSLIRYDWAINKNKFSLTMALIAIIYVCCVLLFFLSKNIFHIESLEPETPVIMSKFIGSFFNYAQLAMVFVVTTLLHQKFTNPRSATNYLSIPGTSAEKYVVMLAEYALGAAAVFVIYLICHSLTMLTCWYMFPALDWLTNPFLILFPAKNLDEFSVVMNGVNWESTMYQMQEVAANEQLAPELLTLFFTTVSTLMRFTPVITLCELFAYMCVNMLFRTNGQLKTIAIYFAVSVVFAITMIICSIVVFGTEISQMAGNVSQEELNNLIMGNVITVLNVMTYFCYATPLLLIGLAYLFYRQICRKQAK